MVLGTAVLLAVLLLAAVVVEVVEVVVTGVTVVVVVVAVCSFRNVAGLGLFSSVGALNVSSSSNSGTSDCVSVSVWVVLVLEVMLGFGWTAAGWSDGLYPATQVYKVFTSLGQVIAAPRVATTGKQKTALRGEIATYKSTACMLGLVPARITQWRE